MKKATYLGDGLDLKRKTAQRHGSPCLGGMAPLRFGARTAIHLVMKTRAVERAGLLVCLGAMALAASGCAHYQYRMVQPSNLASPIAKQPVRVDYPPLMYQLSEQDHRLAMQINNPTEAPITLVGNRSYLVSPHGETHPLRGAIIAPHSYVGMLMPPQNRTYRAYPSFGFGMGVGGWHSGPLFHSGVNYIGEPYWSGPADYYMVNPPNYWEWKTGEVRLNLSYQQTTPAANSFDHQFLFERQKAK